MMARYTSIEMLADDVVAFAIEDVDGNKVALKQAGFEDFVRRAIALMRPASPILDTEQMLNQWFELPAQQTD